MKRILSLILAMLLLLAVPALAETAAPAAPKYVFMFIGDGMGAPQVSATRYYIGTQDNPESAIPVPGALSFTDFENVGFMTTYDASSFCPDSASTATSMASGEKTLSGVINYNIDKTEAFKLITEYAKEAGYKVGVLTSVSVDHATPAAYYSKVESRSQYYDIGYQGLTGATLDFLAGAGFLKPDGAEGASENLYEVAAANGWTVVDTYEGVEALNADSGRVLALTPDVVGGAMPYEIDRAENMLSLADYTKAGINLLDNDNGFFMMVEGGKVDWSCHANDAATSIHDTIAFSDAVQVAVDFAAQHPDETLIVVTGDHETGGLTIGFATTGYDTHFNYLASQKVSYVAFDEIINELRAQGADFETAMDKVTENFGLTLAADQELSLNETEIEKLKTAYALSMIEPADRQLTEEDALLYGGYEPFSMAICHVLNNKAGIAYTSYAHTGLQMPVYAEGVGAQAFAGSYDNTDIFHKLMSIMALG